MNETFVWGMVGVIVAMCVGLALSELINFLESCQCITL